MHPTEITAALNNLSLTLTDRGITATRDPRNLTVPGALIGLEALGTDNLLCGDVTATATVWLIVSGNGGHAAAEDNLLALYSLVSDLTESATTADLALPDGNTYPALKLNPIPLDDFT